MEYVVYKRFKEKGIDGGLTSRLVRYARSGAATFSPRTVAAFAP